MYKAYKTEIKPNKEQIRRIEMLFEVTIATINDYIDYNIDTMHRLQPIASPEEYLELVNLELAETKYGKYICSPTYKTTVLKALSNKEKAFKRYLDCKGGLPHKKTPGTSNISFYSHHNELGKYYIPCQRHRIYVKQLGWVRLKEKGYLPLNRDGRFIISLWIKKKAGRYYVIALTSSKTQLPKMKRVQGSSPNGLGIDVNVNNFAVLSNGTVYPNINKTERVQKLKKKARMYDKKLSRKKNAYLREHPGEEYVLSKNAKKMRCRQDAVFNRMDNIRLDQMKKIVREIIDLKPEYIAMEDLKVKSMLDHKRYSRYIPSQLFYSFRLNLYRKCCENGIEFRLVDKWYPSTRICHECGYKFDKFSLDVRDLVCPSCGEHILRDFNASLNIRDTNQYSVKEVYYVGY